MTSRSNLPTKERRDRSDYGFARARDLAFDAVQALWRRRSAAGMKQTDIARALGHDPAWVSRNLRGPGNWTLRTFGELVEALDGEIEIQVCGLEDPISPRPNFHAYAGYELPLSVPAANVARQSTVPTGIPDSSTASTLQTFLRAALQGTTVKNAISDTSSDSHP